MSATVTSTTVGLIDPLAALLVGVAGLILLVAIFWPGMGVLDRIRRARQRRARVYAEDALKHLYKSELSGRQPTLQSLAGALQVTLNRAAEVVADLQRRDLLASSAPEMKLNVEGRSYALNIIRAHRLWEQHLAEQTGVAESRWHREAERQEHYISPAQADRLAARLGHPTHDPHGDPIPTAAGDYVTRGMQTLAALDPGQVARVTHIEDEPEAVYAQLAAEGLYPGMSVRVLERSPQRVRFWANGEEHVLAPMMATNVSVQPLVTAEVEDVPEAQRLSRLPRGTAARVVRISPRCRGAERRRLLDLGVLPGTEITAEMTSPSGDCTAYRIREALIALRAEQSDLIQVTPLEGMGGGA